MTNLIKVCIIGACLLWMLPTKSIANSTADIKAYYLSADIALRRMELGKATEFLNLLTKRQNITKIKNPMRQQIANMAARTYLMAGDYRKVMGLRKYHESYGFPQALISLRAINQEKWREALLSLETMPVAENNFIWEEWILPIFRIWALAGQGKSGQAFSHFDDLQKKEGLGQVLPLQEILLHLHLRQPQAVLKKLKTPDTLPPQFLAYYLQALAMANRQEEAIEILKNAKNNDNKILEQVRQALENNIDIEVTLTAPKQALSYLFLQLSEILLKDHPKEALLYARLAAFIDEDNFETAYIIADVFARHENYPEAIEVWQDFMPEDDEQKILANLQMSEYLFQLKRYDSAEDLLLRLRRQFPDNIALRDALGSVYLRQDSYDSVVEFYNEEALLPDNKEHWRSFYLRGIAYERLKIWELAEADLLVAYGLVPNNAHVLNYLGYSWIDRGENLQEGFNLLRKAVDLRGNDGAIMDSLGWAYYRLGDYDSSVAYLERAVALSPDVSEILDHLGDAYWQVGRRLEAKFQWKRALKADDMTDELRNVILHKLKDKN